MNWKNEFEGLEELISGLLEMQVAKTAKNAQRTQSDDPLTLVTDAKKNIRRVAFGFKKPKQRSEYIRRHQQELVRMWNEVWEREAVSCPLLAVSEGKEEERVSRSTPVSKADTPASGGQSPDLLTQMYTCLEELHEFLRNDFADCFDGTMHVPKGYLLKVREELKPELPGVITYMIRSKAPEKLMQAVVQPYRNLVEERAPLEWSYEKIEWMKKFSEVVREELKAFPGEVHPRQRGTSHPRSKNPRRNTFYTPLLQQFIYYNFNCAKFKNFLIEAIHEDVDAFESLHEKLERLAYHRRELSKLLVKEGWSYLSLSPRVKDDVCESIERELKHLENKYHLPLVSPVHFSEEEKDAKDAKDTQRTQSSEQELEGIFFGLSVEELGLLISAMTKCGLIRNEKLNKVAAFLAMYCRTVGKEKFSEQYLCNAFSSKSRKAVEGLDSKLMDVVNLLKKWKRQS